MEEKAYIINGKDSKWEHFFLSLENKNPEDWKILAFQNNHLKIRRILDNNIPEGYQTIRYFTKEGDYDIYLKKRFIVIGRDDLFHPEETDASQRNGNRDFASANVMYILKRQQGQTIERFRGGRIKDIYQEIAGLPCNKQN